jgi:hypothetical protein
MSSSSSTASTANAAIEHFLGEYVEPDLLDQARNALCDLFATLHAALALQFVRTYAAPEPTPVPAPAPQAPKKSSAGAQSNMCTGITAKGAACAHKCCAKAPDTFCAVHLQQSLKSSTSSSSSSKKSADKAAEKPMPMPMCSGVTSKGAACARRCCADSDAFCSTHLQQSLKAPKVEKKAKPAPKEKADKAAAPKKAAKGKAPKAVPAHNHPLTEEVEADAASNCDLCQSHGNAASQDLTEVQFEAISGDLQSRLRDILSSMNEVEDEDEEEDEDEPEVESKAVQEPEPEPETDEDEEDLKFGRDALESDADEDEDESDADEEDEDN